MTTAIIDNVADIARRMKELEAQKKGGNLGLLADLKPVQSLEQIQELVSIPRPIPMPPYTPGQSKQQFQSGDQCPQCLNGMLYAYLFGRGQRVRLECNYCNWNHLNP